jgi:hypothetical protein
MAFKFIVVFLLLIVPITIVHAGNEGKGTEDDVLIGLIYKRHLDAKGLAQLKERQSEMRDLIQSGRLKERAESFLGQVQVGDLRNNDPEIIKLYSTVQNKMKPALPKIVMRLATPEKPCLDDAGVVRTATTVPKIGAPICVDVERVSVLELVPELKFPGNDLLFGVFMHELARQLDADEDHEFLVAMAEEAREQFIIDMQSCKPEQALCRSARYNNEFYWNNKNKTMTLVFDTSRTSQPRECLANINVQGFTMLILSDSKAEAEISWSGLIHRHFNIGDRSTPMFLGHDYQLEETELSSDISVQAGDSQSHIALLDACSQISSQVTDGPTVIELPHWATYITEGWENSFERGEITQPVSFVGSREKDTY